MSEAVKITSSHLARMAIVYLRQSSAAQVEHNRESTDRQYALVNKAGDLGWAAGKVVVIDDVITTGGSIIKAIDAVRAVGCEVLLAISVLDRNAGAHEALEKLGVPYRPLVTLADLGIGD